MAGLRLDDRPGWKVPGAARDDCCVKWPVLPRLLLVTAATGAIVLTIDMVSVFTNALSGLLAAAPYAAAAVLFLVSAWFVRVDEWRARLLAIGAAILLASWVVAVGYGPREVASRAIAVVAAFALMATLVGVTRRWLGVTLAVLVPAAAVLLYVAFVHPPLALIAIYAVAAIGVSAAVLALMPRSVRRPPYVTFAAIALAAWLAGVLLFFLAYGAPLSAT
jgi:hypothetical protein